MKYYCETCGKTYNTQEECIICEEKHKVEIEKKKKLEKEYETRKDEVRQAYKHADELAKQFDKDYGTPDIHYDMNAFFDKLFWR